MINVQDVKVKPVAFQVPQSLSNDAQRERFFADVTRYGVSGIDYMEGDQWAIAHVGIHDGDGNYCVAMEGEYLVAYPPYPEFEVFSEDRFHRLFQV